MRVPAPATGSGLRSWPPMKPLSAWKCMCNWQRPPSCSVPVPPDSASRPTPMSAKSARACPARCPSPTARPCITPRWWAWPPIAPSTAAPSSPVKTIFIRTCPRVTRSRSLICPSASTATWISWRKAKASASALPASTWKMTRATTSTPRERTPATWI